ncbi:hypothetical protein NQ314_004285 [Rhamnusium bicolor]|uniref:Homeobox domain-containing protein n=1 Tax=Rhamnusium bicolor TaxID=1586634 RepID=A0AAV8ZLS8_9CUCU|nr:hypothetical protein NQ314_004285 [Rhamnusium bicolor]
MINHQRKKENREPPSITYKSSNWKKRFLYQKYVSPAVRDEIASSLGITNAQVITWFQNRRAKLKRDMEELKKDVENPHLLSAHKSFLENITNFGVLKKKSLVNENISFDVSEK